MNRGIRLFYLISTNYVNSLQEYIVHNAPLTSHLHSMKDTFSRNISKHLDIVMFDMHKDLVPLLSVYYNRSVHLIPHCWEPLHLSGVLAEPCDSRRGDIHCKEMATAKTKNKYTFVILEANKVITKNCFVPLIVASAILKSCGDTTIMVPIHVCCTTTGMRKKIRGAFPHLNIVFHGHVDVHSFLMNIYRTGVTPVVISHHNQNESNYMLYEMLHYMVPLIHTSPSLRQYGLYYDVTHPKFTESMNSLFNVWRSNGFITSAVARQILLAKVSTKNADVRTRYTEMFFG